jgi:hypothetical protein
LERANSGSVAGCTTAYIRGIFESALSLAESEKSVGLERFACDAVSIRDVQKRSVQIFIKIMTTSFVRDYLISRFLSSKTEFVIHSRITRELEIDSDLR